MEVATVDLKLLDSLFAGSIIHLTGGPGVGKSLLLLYYLGHRALEHDEGVLWIDAGGSLPPNRVNGLFGRDAPAALSHILVARVNSIQHMKEVAAEIAASGVPPGTDHLVVDPISRWPRLALTQTAHSGGQAGYVAQDFFSSVVEPILFAAARDGFHVYLAHENSQDHPFWWDRYPARQYRVHLRKDPRCPGLREICNAQGECLAILDLGNNPINLLLTPRTKLDEAEEVEPDETV